MKNCKKDLIEFLASKEANELKVADLYKFMLTNGEEIYYTNADFNIIKNGNLYSCKSAGISRSNMSWETGLSVDDVTVELNPGDDDKIGNLSLVEAFRNGTFDGAEIQVDWAVYKDGWEKEPLFLDCLFVGNVDVDEVTECYVKLNIKSKTEYLNTNFPSSIYQASCPYALYSTPCSVSRTNFSENSHISTASTKKELHCNTSHAAGYYQNGIVKFTSGSNYNIKRSIKYHKTGVLILSTPLQYVPGINDTFIIYAGCDKQMSTCKNKFNNLDNFGGTPFIPSADSTL